MLLYLLLAHRALSDVEAMEELFTMPALQDLLSTLPKRTAMEQITKYEKCWKIRKQTMELYHALRRQITKDQAKQLVNLNLMYNDLLEMKLFCPKEEFMKKLLKKGVRNKDLVMNLFSILC